MTALIKWAFSIEAPFLVQLFAVIIVGFPLLMIFVGSIVAAILDGYWVAPVITFGGMAYAVLYAYGRRTGK